MSFTLIDEKIWQRKAHFHHYLTDVPCTYSATFKLDVTAFTYAALSMICKIYSTFKQKRKAFAL